MGHIDTQRQRELTVYLYTNYHPCTVWHTHIPSMRERLNNEVERYRARRLEGTTITVNTHVASPSCDIGTTSLPTRVAHSMCVTHSNGDSVDNVVEDTGHVVTPQTVTLSPFSAFFASLTPNEGIATNTNSKSCIGIDWKDCLMPVKSNSSSGHIVCNDNDTDVVPVVVKKFRRR